MAKSDYIRVKDIDHMRQLIEEGKNSFFIALNYGARSSKSMFFCDDPDKFHIINEIDDSEQDLTAEELFNEDLTNIGKAIKMGAFYNYNF